MRKNGLQGNIIYTKILKFCRNVPDGRAHGCWEFYLDWRNSMYWENESEWEVDGTFKQSHESGNITVDLWRCKRIAVALVHGNIVSKFEYGEGTAISLISEMYFHTCFGWILKFLSNDSNHMKSFYING